jgi:hypothetical protein
MGTVMYQIELVGGPLDGQHRLLDVNDYPAQMLFYMEPDLTEATECTVDYKLALYRKRPRPPRTLAAYYDFDGIH